MGEVVRGKFPQEPFEVTKQFWQKLQDSDQPVGSAGTIEAVPDARVQEAEERLDFMKAKLYNAKTDPGSMSYLRLVYLARQELAQTQEEQQNPQR